MLATQTNSRNNGLYLIPGGNPDGQCYQTPRHVFEKLHSVFGFTIDACASEGNALLPRFWTEEQDALRQDWTAEVAFCNPPFNNIAPFLLKAKTARRAVVLAPLNFLTSNGFQETGADHIVIPQGRVNFITGKKQSKAKLGTCFLVYGPLAAEEMARLDGTCVTMQVMHRFLNRVFWCNAIDLLRRLPDCSIDLCVSDTMYGTGRDFLYDWGVDPARGDPAKHWAFHEPLYRECLRVLKPGGILAWAQGIKFSDFFDNWFGPHGVWTPVRIGGKSKTVSGHVWVLQTKDRQPLPNFGGIVKYDRLPPKSWHPCPKPVEELTWLLERIAKPGQIVLDSFCGLGSTLIAAEQIGCSWIGCDLSPHYCRRANFLLNQMRRALHGEQE
jgi:site-specific DNA-methyltransferase (adenine-specific)